RFGHRVDEVEYHPAWHSLLRAAVEHGLHASPWREPGPGAHVARAAGFFVLTQAEAGVGCPISMTYSAVPALRASPEVARAWEPRLLSVSYDPRNHAAGRKGGALAGMRLGVTQALHHASHRTAFGKRLIDHPLMQNVLADLALESEAATATMARLARAYDQAQTDGDARRFARLATAVCKYWVCKRAP